eukprot:CAMPEP_0197040394 /NCGR_PEP_ID=MMETSP1384-20130603/17101_1 /TAXON_ID=29189 /ORGANISM="Ammonia sp." /LENGTH=384 /DNA_ID=CAMNT_0042471141 /DNA_START=57 /DNA_END=1211 /DNA_ORIENTATION=+
MSSSSQKVKDQVKAKMNKILAKPKKKMKTLLSNKRKGYSKLAVTHESHGVFTNDYEDEELEMELELNYDMNESMHYEHDPDNALSTLVTAADPHHTTSFAAIKATKAPGSTSVTQTYIDDIMDQGISRRTEYCVVPFYLMVTILSVITTGLLCIHEISEVLGMCILTGFSVLGAVMGMYGVFAWGMFDDVLSYLTRQNDQYQENIDRLNSMGEVLQNDVDDINGSVDALKRDGNALENTMKQYRQLRRQLAEICEKQGIDGSHESHHGVLQFVNELNAHYDEMKAIMQDNEKAHLLSIFYSVRLYDFGNNGCLSKKQYHKFLMYCNSETRAKFERLGGFDAMDREHSGLVNMQEFEEMVNKVLMDTVQESEYLSGSSIKIHDRL